MSDEPSSAPEPALVAGRSCGGCTMCCKLLGIKGLDKPRLKWCLHCAIGTGCRIYENRPTECRDFYCSYLLDPTLEEHWYPARSKMVVTTHSLENKVTIYVDSARPDAWRAEPYHSEIRRWAAEIARRNGQCIVHQGRDLIVVLPAGEKNLGPVPEGRAILVTKTLDPSGVVWDAMVADPDDPRVVAARQRMGRTDGAG